MRQLPPPATGTELYLAAIHEELRALRVALVDGGTQEPATGAAVPIDGMGDMTTPRRVVAEPSVTPTKRTRSRPPRG